MSVASKPCTRRKAQPELDLGADPPPPDDVAELLAMHERLRAEALRRHGLAVTGWPSRGTGKRKAIEARLRKAIDAHGADACRRYIEHRAAEWRDDAGPLLAYPPDQTWSPRIVGPTLARLDAQRRPAAAMPRASPANTRPPVTRPLPRFDDDDQTEETRPPC